MPRPELFNILTTVTLGACMMATAYHIVLYSYYRDKLFLHYTAYLGCMCLFIFLRSEVSYFALGKPMAERLVWYFNEGVQILYFLLYINFLAHALGVTNNRRSIIYKGLQLLNIVLAIYGITAVVLHFCQVQLPALVFIVSRVFIFGVTVAQLAYVMRSQTNPFRQWIFLGSIYFFVCGLLAFISNQTVTEPLGLGPLEWLMAGNLGEILFFSSAMGYRLKLTSLERQAAIELAVEEKAQKMAAVMQTRLDERNRIARELHDDMGSSVSSIRIYSEVLMQQHNTETGQKYSGRISHISQELMERMSDLVWAINPTSDSTSGIVRHIKEYAVPVLEAKQMSPIFSISLRQDVQWGPEQKKNIYLLVKEAVNNAIKYSCAKQLTVAITETDSQLLIGVSDNGNGFNMQLEKAGNGLRNMHQRAAYLHAPLSVETKPGQGCHITAAIPFTTISG